MSLAVPRQPLAPHSVMVTCFWRKTAAQVRTSFQKHLHKTLLRHPVYGCQTQLRATASPAALPSRCVAVVTGKAHLSHLHNKRCKLHWHQHENSLRVQRSFEAQLRAGNCQQAIKRIALLSALLPLPYANTRFATRFVDERKRWNSNEGE